MLRASRHDCGNRDFGGRAVRARRFAGLGSLVAAPCAAIALLASATASATVAAAPTPVSTVAPTLTGTPLPGQTLTCSTGSWTNNPTTFTFAWLRNGVAIAGQLGNTYVVQAADRGHSISCQVTASNSGGEYTVVGLPSDSYKVEFSPAYESNLNYLLQYYNNQSVFANANPVGVTAPNLTPGINAALQTGGQITGRVTAAGGGPLANVFVCASQKEFFGNCVMTNGAGEYAIVGLPTGSYTVEFVTSFFFETGAGNYVGQYYNGKSKLAEADPVAVTAGATASGINAELQKGGQISGHVTGEGAGSLANVAVCALGEGGLFPTCAFTDAAGDYTINGLAGGKYKVAFLTGIFGAGAESFLSQYYNNKTLITEAEPVTVTLGAATTGIGAQLHEGGKITGTVTDATSHVPLANIEACGGNRCATTDALGKYTIVGVASGTYSVTFTATEGVNYVSETVPGVKVTAGSTTSSVEATMQRGGQIAGTVTDAVTHTPVAKVRVCVTTGGFRCAFTNASGQYTVMALPTGTYNLEFSLPEGVNYLSQAISSVNVTAGGTTAGVDAALVAGGQMSGRVTAAFGGTTLANIEVCAREVGGAEITNCAITNGPGSSATSASNALAVPIPTSAFSQAKKPKFDAKSGNLIFYFKISNAGKFTWSLFFRNADVGFTAAVGASLGEGQATAEAAKKCKKGYIKHRGRCVRRLVPFSSGSKAFAAAGVVEVKAHASAKAIKALKAGRTLHISGKFTFQSALGGTPVSHTVSVTVRLPKKHGKKHGKK